MKGHFIKLLAMVLIISGAIKMFLEATRQDTLFVPTCLGQTISVQLPGNAWAAMHCWGCYAFATGCALLVAHILTSVVTRRASI